MTDHDIRKIPVRFLGYSMALSEALKFSFSSIKLLSFCRGITIGYAIFDMTIKTREAKKKSSKNAVITAADVFLWQTSASVILPTIAVNQFCWTARILMYNLKAPLANVLTTSIGLSMIPTIIEPIDYVTDFVLDATYRKYIPVLIHSEKNIIEADALPKELDISNKDTPKKVKS